MVRLSISLFGAFQVSLNGQEIVRFDSDKVRALLAYLALESDRPHRREALAALLWPERTERSARHSLSQALFNLRTLLGNATVGDDLGKAILTADRETIQFSANSDYWLDVRTFVEAIHASRSHGHRDLSECMFCAQRLQQAIDLYRGELLAGFAPDSAPFEEWLVVRREERHRQALDALYHLGAYHLGRGDHERVIHYARRQIELEPWSERAYRQWMRALALSGQRGAALAQYEECRRVLQEELAIEPEPETAALYERIRDGQDLSGFPADASSDPDRSVSNLPAQLTPFIGRENLLAEIAERLRDPACRLLTLVGPGGSGKTRLALEAAARQLDSYPDGAFFVSLAPLQSAEAVVPTIAQAIGFSFYGGRDPREQLLNYLRHKKMLLILDDAEHLLRQHPIAGPESGQRDVVDVALDILREASEVVVLVTSRVRLGALGEHVLSVGEMNLPPLRTQTVDADGGPYSALQLFLSVGRRVKPEFDLTADNLPHVVHICHLLRGMPLAIVLAASWIRMLTPAEIERELAPDLDAQESGHGLDFLAADLHDVPARQRSIRAVFDRSWRLLTARECGVMEALSVFRGGCTREAAQEVAGASLRDLGSLVDRSLLQRDAPSRDGRFEMHELLRQYAAEKLAASPDAGWAVRDRHSAYYLAALRKWEGALKDARQQATLAEMDAEVDNVRAAWEWAVGRGRIEPLERAAAGLSLYCELRSRDPEGEAAFRATADRLEGMYGAGGTGPVEKVPVVGLRALARMRMWQGVSACQWHLTAIAERSLRQSLELLDRPELAACDMRLERGILLYTLGHLGFDAGREDTVQRFEESLALFRALDNRWWAGRALYFLAILAMDAAEYAGARQQFEEALTLFRAQGDLHWSANVSIMASAIYYKMGQIEQGEPLAREGLALMQALGDRAGTALGLENLACFACRAGEYAEFDALMERCLALWDDLGTRRTTVMWHVGEAKMHLGQYECARTLVQQEIDLLQERGQQREACYNVIMIGMVALAEGAYEETHRSLKKSISMCQEFRLSGFLADAEAAMGYAARGIGRPDQAREHLAEALRLGRKQDSWPPVVLALPAIALLLADRGAAEQAVELYALATIFPYVANSRWFEDVAGKHIAAAAALPPQVVAAAQERGRARDLWATVEELLAELEMDS